MAVAIGSLIVSGLSAAGVTGVAGFSLASTTIAGVGLSTVLGSAAIIGASIGLQYALAPKPPGPENGAVPLKQAVPPRIRGYGRNRLAGYYMLFEEVSKASYDVLAWHSGRAWAIDRIYLHDDPIVVGGDGLVVNNFSDGRYGDNQIFIETRLGDPSQSAASFYLDGSGVNTIWTANHKGNGIAWLAMKCNTPGDPANYTTIYPHGLPSPSVVARCSPVWDPRNPLQDRNDPFTWEYSVNPVLHLIDYLTRADGGMGLDYDIIIGPRIAEWVVEANICDEQAIRGDGLYENRYACHGFFQYDNNPEDVIGGILSTCDGWLCEDIDGTLSLKVGVYRDPDGDAIEGKAIVGFTNIQFGQADEQTVNQLDITFTDPNQSFSSVQLDPYRDEDAISESGIVRAKPLDLKWVQSDSQASRLGYRALLRVNPEITCTIITDLTALDWVGQRWVPVKYPFIAGLEDCVMENQGAEIDLAAGRIAFNFNLVVPSKVNGYDPETDEKPAPPIPPLPPGAITTNEILREDGSGLIREDGTSYIREDA
jgi:hypothetical protein